MLFAWVRALKSFPKRSETMQALFATIRRLTCSRHARAALGDCIQYSRRGSVLCWPPPNAYPYGHVWVTVKDLSLVI